MIDDAKLNELAAKAEKATPGPWQQSHFVDGPRTRNLCEDAKTLAAAAERRTIRGAGKIGEPDCNVILHVDGMNAPRDTAYIAAANPETIAALVAEVKRWRAVPQQIAHLANTPHTRASRHGRLFVDYEALKELFPEAAGERG